jgi:hypothetical protein
MLGWAPHKSNIGISVGLNQFDSKLIFMKLDITPNLCVEQDDGAVLVMLDKIRMRHPGPLPHFTQTDSYDWLLVSIEITNHKSSEGTLSIIQHLGKDGDSGYMGYVLKEMFKNRHELDHLIKLFEHASKMQKARGEKWIFSANCAEMIKGLRMGTSMNELLKNGILHTPPPSLN